MTLDIEIVPQEDHRLGRNKVHDSRSRAFPLATPVDRSTWRDKSIRIYDPLPNPNQPNGCCTACAKSMQLNAVGNREAGRVLRMPFAQELYTWETQHDEFDGQMPEQDTGSSGLASCKGAIEFGVGSKYQWLFGGADEVVQAVMMGGVISVGTWWYEAMFHPWSTGLVEPLGERVGGHQYVIRGYDKSRDLVLGRCWWGSFRDFWMKRSDLDNLLRDGGDAHWQRSV